MFKLNDLHQQLPGKTQTKAKVKYLPTLGKGVLRRIQIKI